MAKASGNTTTGKRGTRNEARRDTSTTSLKSDGKTMTNIVLPKLFIAVQESIFGILTISQQSTCLSWKLGSSDPDTKTAMYWASTTVRRRVVLEEGTIFRKQARQLGALQREQGRVVSNICKRLRERHRHVQRKNAIRSSTAKWDLECPLVACILLIFNRLMEVGKMARTTTRRMATQVVLTTVSFQNIFLVQELLKLLIFPMRTGMSESRARDGV